MIPGFSPLLLPPRVSGCPFRSWPAVVVLAGLLAATCPLPTFAARSSSAGTHSPAAPATPVGAPPVGRLTNPNDTDLNSLSQLARLATPPPQGYDIVPPEHPNLVSSGPLPGYQMIRLGRARYNRLCLSGTIGGTKGLMMLDTGAKTTALSEANYRSLLLNASYTLPAGLPRAVNYNGIRTPLAEAPDFYVGHANLGAVPVCLLPRSYLLDPDRLGSKGRLYDGLLGENILRHYDAVIDCARLALYLNVDPARKRSLSSTFVHNGWTPVPISDTGNALTVPCVLNGHKFRLIVDTGAPFTNLDRNLLAGAQIGSHDLRLRGGLIGTVTQPAGLVDLDHLQIGDYTATGVRMTATPQSLAAFGGPHDSPTAEPIVGLLGGDTLALNGAVIDTGNKVLYLKHSAGKVSKSQ